MSAWSHLPNAAHIDRVLDSVKASPKIWADVSNAVPEAAHNAAYDAALDAVIDAAWNAAWKAVRKAARDDTWDASYFTAWYAITALFAYDDAAKYLDLPLDQLQMLYALTEHPAALLLQPAVIAFSMEKALA